MNEMTTKSAKVVGDSADTGTQSVGTVHRYMSEKLLNASYRRQPDPYVFLLLSCTLWTFVTTTL